jgi:sulfopropanediol 3-dehydrogenase
MVATAECMPRASRTTWSHLMIRYLKKSKPVEAQAEIAAQVRDTVEQIIANVAKNGDAAVREYSKKFDKWEPSTFRLSDEEIAACVASLSE